MTQDESVLIPSEPEPRGFHWFIATVLTIWCLAWVLFNGYGYIYLTWHLFVSLKWFSFALLINPCFAIWIGFFSSSIWAPLNFSALPWGRFGAELSRRKVALLVLLVPPVLGLALQFVGPYFYPISWGGDDGTRMFMRLIPILGGKGYN